MFNLLSRTPGSFFAAYPLFFCSHFPPVPSNRRNTSVDENYEWDSEFPGDMELLEPWHLGLASSRPRPELEPELGM